MILAVLARDGHWPRELDPLAGNYLWEMHDAGVALDAQCVVLATMEAAYRLADETWSSVPDAGLRAAAGGAEAILGPNRRPLVSQSQESVWLYVQLACFALVVAFGAVAVVYLVQGALAATVGWVAVSSFFLVLSFLAYNKYHAHPRS
jgi:hypothetical protein